MPEHPKGKGEDSSDKPEKVGGTESKKAPTNRPNIDELKQEILQQDAAQRVANDTQEASAKVQKALSITVMDPTDSDYEIDADDRAMHLAHRHNDLCIAEDIVQLVLDCEGPVDSIEREGLIDKLEAHRKHANKNGFFLMRYTPEFVKSRLTAAPYSVSIGGHDEESPSYIVAEAAGKKPNADGAVEGPPLWASDCNVNLPEPSSSAQEVISSLQDGDTITMEHYANELKNKPWSMAIVDDLTCEEDMQHLGLAGASMAKAIESIVERVNPKRGEFPIEYIAAEIASIRGVVLPEGKKIMLPDLEVNPIGNGRSRYVFEHCRFGFEHAWELVDREHEVLLPGDDPSKPHKVIVKWWVMVADLKKLKKD